MFYIYIITIYVNVNQELQLLQSGLLHLTDTLYDSSSFMQTCFFIDERDMYLFLEPIYSKSLETQIADDLMQIVTYT